MLPKEFYYLVGVALGDGYLSVSPKKYFNGHGFYYKYYFTLDVKDKEFALRFKKCLEKVFNIKTNLNTGFWKLNGKKFKRFRVGTQKKDIVNFMVNKLKELKLNDLKRTEKLEILRGLFDSEGSVSVSLKRDKHINSKIQFAQKIGNRGIKIFESCLKTFKISYSKNQYGNKTYFRINCSSYKRLHDLFGRFTIERKEENFEKWLALKNRTKIMSRFLTQKSYQKWKESQLKTISKMERKGGRFLGKVSTM